MKTELLSLSPADFCGKTDACSEGIRYATKFKTMSDVWENCSRVDWMIWILNAIDAPQDEKALRLYAVWCARNTPLADGRTTGDLLTDPRSLSALVVAERFANGQATREELAAAGDAAWAAAGAAAWAAAGAAAWAAAGDAAWAAAGAAAWDAAGAAARAAAWAAAGDSAWAAQSKHFRTVVANPFKQ